MLKRKTCKSCKKSLNSKYDYCPYCGNMLEGKGEDFGMLGKTDSDLNENEIKLPMGFNSLFNSLMRNLDKQVKDINKKDIPADMRNFNISISSLGNMFPQQIKINPINDNRSKIKKQEEIKRFFFNNLSSENFKRFSKLPKEEPKTSMQRVENRISYEVLLPGVKSIKDISIMRLENSMELKAVAEKKAYSKTIQINLPIIDYHFSKGKLTLEMDVQGN